MKTLKSIIKEIEAKKLKGGFSSPTFDWNKSSDRSRLEWKIDRELNKLSKIQETLNLK